MIQCGDIEHVYLMTAQKQQVGTTDISIYHPKYQTNNEWQDYLLHNIRSKQEFAKAVGIAIQSVQPLYHSNYSQTFLLAGSLLIPNKHPFTLSAANSTVVTPIISNANATAIA